MSLADRLNVVERAAEQLQHAPMIQRPAFYAALGDALLAWSRDITAEVDKLKEQYEELANESRNRRPG